MSDPAAIPSDSAAVIDTSVLFAMGGPENEKYRAFERAVRRKNVTVFVPEQVAEELGESPAAYGYRRERLRAARDAGWLRPATTDFSVEGVPDVVDRPRERMATLSADDVTEDEIETTDTVLAGLAYQLASRRDDHVTVFVSDRIAERAIRDACSATALGDRILVVEGRAYLRDLTDE